MFTVLKSVREYKWVSLVTPLLKILEVVMEVLIPFYMANLIDYGIDKGDMGYVVQMGIILVCFTVLSLAFGIGGGITSAIASPGFAKNLRTDMYYNVQKSSFSNIYVCCGDYCFIQDKFSACMDICILCACDTDYNAYTA